MNILQFDKPLMTELRFFSALPLARTGFTSPAKTMIIWRVLPQFCGTGKLTNKNYK